MVSKEKILEKLKALKPELERRYKVREIGLFGSWARGEQGSQSDIDVLVEFADGADLFDWIGLALYLEEIFGCRVDVVPRQALRPELRDNVGVDYSLVWRAITERLPEIKNEIQQILQRESKD